MNIRLENFNHVATLDISRVVIEGGQLRHGSQNFLGRAISIMTGARQRENKAIYESFAGALESEFGTAGRSVLSDILPNDRFRLSSATIRQVLDRSRTLMLSEYHRLHVPHTESTKLGHCIEGNLVAPMARLGSGACNTVYLGTYRFPGGSEFTGVFKKETSVGGGWVADQIGINPANPQFGMRNIATYRLNQLLGLDVIPRTEFGTHQGRLGIVMGLAPGSSPVKTDYEFELTGKSGDPSLDFLADKKAVLEKLSPSALQSVASRNGLEELRFDGDRLMAVGNVDVDIKFEDPALLEGLNDLQWLDALCAQGDRHCGNYLVEHNTEGKVTRVTGIDNDQSFGEKIRDPNDIKFGSDTASYGFHGCSLPDVISLKTAQALKQLTSEKLRDTLSGLLTKGEIDACVERLEAIKKRVADLEGSAGVIDPGGWDFHDAKLAAFWTDPGVSYVARDRTGFFLIEIAYDGVVANK